MVEPCPLHIVSGKGGVGKTSIAVALAAALATEGRRVLVCEVENRQGLQLATGVLVGSAPGALFNAGAGRVVGMSVDPRRALRGYLEHYYRLGFAADVLQLTPLVEFATSIAPGLRDILLLGQVINLTQPEHGFDAIVLDAPPAGRVTAFLGAADALTRIAEGGPVEEQAASVMTALRRPTCRVHVVSTLEELPVTEAAETTAQLLGLGLAVGAVIANLVSRGLPDVPATTPAPGQLTPSAWRTMLATHDVARQAGAAADAWRSLLEYRTGRAVRDVPELTALTSPDDFRSLGTHLAGA